MSDQIERWSAFALTVLLAFVFCAGCESSGPAGPLDKRRYGTWESRRGFVGTDTIAFRDDGTMQVTANDGTKKKGCSGQWYVQQSGKSQVSVNMQAQGKEAFRLRKLKFREDGTFEMLEGNKILGRFEKKS